jgi:hypothetical protein
MPLSAQKNLIGSELSKFSQLDQYVPAPAGGQALCNLLLQSV